MTHVHFLTDALFESYTSKLKVKTNKSKQVQSTQAMQNGCIKPNDQASPSLLKLNLK